VGNDLPGLGHLSTVIRNQREKNLYFKKICSLLHIWRVLKRTQNSVFLKSSKNANKKNWM